jgi:hypothetical protein
MTPGAKPPSLELCACSQAAWPEGRCEMPEYRGGEGGGDGGGDGGEDAPAGDRGPDAGGAETGGAGVVVKIVRASSSPWSELPHVGQNAEGRSSSAEQVGQSGTTPLRDATAQPPGAGPRTHRRRLLATATASSRHPDHFSNICSTGMI